jgi:hypothetical protein
MKIVARTKTKTMEQILEVHKQIDAIVESGGRVGLNDPLTRKLYALRAKAARGE